MERASPVEEYPLCGSENIGGNERNLNAGSNTTNNDDHSDDNDSEVLRDTIKLYGTLLLLFILLFSWVRRQFPRVYNIRKWVDGLKSYLADDQHGFISWMWHVYDISDDELMDECGMDALCFVRLIDMGFRLSLVGIFNALWLIPIYLTAEHSNQTQDIQDDIVKTTIAHVPSGSSRLYATIFAAYIMFGYTMYLILKEFDWYIEARHRFLRKRMARHFAVFVRNVPIEYRNNQNLEAFFRRCFTNEDVLEARLAINAPGLAKVLANRDATLANLEHALAVYEREGVRPRHNDTLLVLGSEVDSIECYSSELEKLNNEVGQRIDQLNAVVRGSVSVSLAQNGSGDEEPQTTSDQGMDQALVPLLSAQGSQTNGNGLDPLAAHHTEPSQSCDRSNNSVHFSGSSFSEDQTARRGGGNTLDKLTKTFNRTVKNAQSVAGRAVDTATSVANKATSVATDAAGRAVTMVLGGDEGEIISAGFVVFTKHSTANAALQMIHHKTPFTMEVMEAPDPKDIFWGNVSRTHEDIQLGMLLSFGMAAGVCLLWTIPMSFFASLSNASAVRSDVKWLDEIFSNHPLLVPITEQLAPFLVVISNASLPTILGAIALFEGPISTGVVEASKFTKLATFMIIQTFFVSAISGGVFQAISAILKDWREIVTILSNSLPAQGTYFMQIMLSMTTVTSGFEMFRIYPLVTAALRSKIGPNRTEKERKKIFMSLRPLSDPPPFPHADFTSRLVLYYMIFFVYSVISPLTPLITGACLAVKGTIFRGQFIYIYGPRRDSGGKLWAHFIQIMLSCMLIAQVTIFGLLGLKKAAKQIPLFFPLPIITVLFNFYIRQMHFRVASYLPTDECLVEDTSLDESCDLSFLRGAYTQPQLTAERNPIPEGNLEGVLRTTEGYGAC
ncbi:hypothetical protein ACA910_005220 [Epithemia clementina (nom. ined.)]